jgi:hypothetical protein
LVIHKAPVGTAIEVLAMTGLIMGVAIPVK